MIDEEAAKIYTQQLEGKPEDLNVRFCLACALFRLEKYAQAQEHFENILALDRESLEAKLSHDWLEKIYSRLRPENETDKTLVPPDIFPLSVTEIVQTKKISSAVDENYCFFHTDKEKKYSCSYCKKSLCGLCGSLRKGIIMCPECVAKNVVKAGWKREKKMRPLLGGALSGLIVSVFVSLFTSALQRLGIKMFFLGYTQENLPPYILFYFIQLCHFAVLCALAGVLCEYHGRVSFFACADYCGRTGLYFGLLFSLLTGTETSAEFAIPLFQFWLLLFLSGFSISFIYNTFYAPMESITWRR